MACPGVSSGGVAGRSHGLGPDRQQPCRQQRAQQDEDRKNPSAGPRSVTAACISNDCGHLQLCQYSFLVSIMPVFVSGVHPHPDRASNVFLPGAAPVHVVYSPSLEMLLQNSSLFSKSGDASAEFIPIFQVWRCFCGIHPYSPSLEMLLRNSSLMVGSDSALCRLRHIPKAFSRAYE